jgi:hypothetical protein
VELCREPTQVFTLLETSLRWMPGEVFSKSRRSAIPYVAVVGLSHPEKDLVVMVRFASDCRDAMMIVTRKLSKSPWGLTPAISNYGLHSGPRGCFTVKSRFQL